MLDCLARILDEVMFIIFPDQFMQGFREEYKQEFQL